MIHENLRKLIKNSLEDLSFPEVDFGLEHPADDKNGDFSSNVAMVLYGNYKDLGENDSGQARMTSKSGAVFNNPREVAEEIVKKLGEVLRLPGGSNTTRNAQDDKLAFNKFSQLVKDVKVAGPGFINFYLTDECLVSEMRKVANNDWEKPYLGKKISVEYTDPNPFKEFHIGHLYSNLIGESVARMFEACGATVWRADFYGDVGMHIAKATWGLLKLKDQNSKFKTVEDFIYYLEKKSIKERQAVMGQGYARGVNAYEEDDEAKEEIKDINYMVYVASQEVLVAEKEWEPLVDYKQYIVGKEDKYPRVKEIYQTGLKWSLAYFETYYQRLGTKFDGYYPESWVGELGLQVVEKGLSMGVLTMGEEGAVVFEGEKDGLHTRVFRNKLGLPTYEAKDLGLVKAKYGDFEFDFSLNVFGKEIDEYYKVVKKVLEQVEPELGKKQSHLAHGMVNLPEGKMSSRKGNVITVEWLLNEVRDRALELMTKRADGEIASDALAMTSGSSIGDIAEMVGQGAVKYGLLRSNIGDDVTFDFGQSVSFNGNSGPYIQYTAVRGKSVLQKLKLESQNLNLSDISLNEEEKRVVSWAYRYPEILVEAAEKLSPHIITTYLYELAGRFNSFYNKHSVVNAESEEKRRFRLFLTSCVVQILTQGLGVLGIKVPERM